VSEDLTPPPPSPLEPLAADAAVAQASDAHAHHGPIHTHCENCGTKLEGPYCHKCGQHDLDVHRSFGHMFLEALENLFHFDGKFFRNIITLLFRPGVLTAEFNAGKRAAQMPPFRLYIFTAFFFFLWVFSTSKTPDALQLGPAAAPGIQGKWTVDGQPVTFEQALKARNDPVYAEQLRKELAAELEKRGMEKAEAKRTVDQVRDFADHFAAERLQEKKSAERNQPHVSLKPSDKPAEKQNDLERWFEEQGRRSLSPEFQKEMAHAFIGALPKMLLFCLPFFALYTRLLFRKSGQVYLQHLILALHFHTFIFLWVMFRDGWIALARLPGLGVQGWVGLAGNAWLALYPLLMLRRLFGNGWIVTVVKTFVLALGYVFTLAVAFFLTAIVLFLLM
jgi:hypothetical protein